MHGERGVDGMTKDTDRKPAAQPEQEGASLQDALDVLLGDATQTSDTANAMVEAYERVERVYRASALAGRPASTVAARTDLSIPI